MPADARDPDFEPEWLWGTRVTAEAARAARAKSRTSQERFEIYELLILAACEARKRRDVPNTVAQLPKRPTSAVVEPSWPERSLNLIHIKC